MVGYGYFLELPIFVKFYNLHLFITRCLNVILWDVFANEPSIGMNCAVKVINFKNLLICVDNENLTVGLPQASHGTTTAVFVTDSTLPV